MDYINIGSTPAEEDCTQIGTLDYLKRTRVECEQFIEAIRKKLGKEPDGARLKIMGFDHEFGRYHEVVCEFADANEPAMEYAFLCESDAPVTWNEVGMVKPKHEQTR
jgi:hypothetical protein